MLQLLPLYRQKYEKAKRIQVKKWDADADSVDMLKGCMDCTDWDVFIKSSANVNEATNVISGHITFCEELCIPVKQTKCFPNSNPWVDSEIKNLLCQKRDIWKNETECQWKYVKRKVTATIEQKKDHYRVKLENQFASGKTKQMWHGMQMITGYKKKEKRICVENENQVANEMNIFFARFKTIDLAQERALEFETLNSENRHPITLQVEEVKKELAKINPKKDPGPARSVADVLESAAENWPPPPTISSSSR